MDQPKPHVRAECETCGPILVISTFGGSGDSMNTLTTLAASVGLATAVCAGPIAQPKVVQRERLCFVDEAAKDESFQVFRDFLVGVVERKDTGQLIGSLWKDIRVGIYEPGGIDKFVEVYEPANPDSAIWRDLSRILNLGGTFIEPRVFCAPYVRCPGPRRSSSLSVVILGNKVPAHALPSSDSEIVEWLSCDVVAYDGDDLPPAPRGAEGWVAVFLGQRWAFVSEGETRMIGDTYFHASKIDGRWVVTTFLGD